MFKPILAAAALAVSVTSVTLPLPAAAQNYYGTPSYGQQGRGQQDWGQQNWGQQNWQERGSSGYENVGYRQNRKYRNNRRYSNNRNGRCYDKGNGGLAIGGIAGGLAGNSIAGRGDKTLGTILGAGVGALAGRAIDKSDGRRC